MLPVPDEYVELIQAEGFVEATATTLRNVLENTARIDELTKTLDEVVAVLGQKMEALEHRPDPPAKPGKP